MTPLAPLPTLRRPQPMEALDRANAIRVSRARVKRNLAALSYREGLYLAAELLADVPDELASMSVRRLLTSCNHVGSSKSNRIFRGARVSETVTLGGLTERQRRDLVTEVRDRADLARTPEEAA